jgi:hypothetical protein
MKMYVFSPIDNSYKVSYLTNGVGTNDRLFINEIKSEVAGVVTPGLCSAGQLIGLYDEYVEVTKTELVAKAIALNMNLMVYEDRAAAANINERLCNFLTFTIPTATDIVIDHDALTIDMNVPFGTTVTALVASFTTTNAATVKIGATAQVSGTTENNFTSAVDYIVTSKDAVAHKHYTVTVTILAE